MTNVLDISKHQGAMNFTTAKSRGIKAVMLRAAYGEKKDTKLDEFYKGAVSAGLSVGAYIFSTWHYHSVSPDFETAEKNAEKQTKAALSHLSGKKITAPVAIDLELESGAELKFTKSQLTDLLEIAVNTVKKAGYTPVLYCSVSWLYDRLDPDKVSCPLWLAYYYDGAKKEAFPETKYGKLLSQQSDRLVLWQHSSKGGGSYYGASSTYVDMNFCYNEEAMGISSKTSSATQTLNAKEQTSLYTVKIKKGSWYIRSLYSASAKEKAVITGGVSLQASQKKNGWYYLTKYNGWIGPAAVESSSYNSSTVSSYTVKSGDTLTKIAQKYSTTIENILKNNKATYPKITKDYIQVGWVLKL